MMHPETARILIVDDDVDICHNLSDILTDMGYVVDSANEGSTALEMVRTTPYDLALLDYKMPGMSGIALYREIKAIRPQIVAFLVTAHADSIADEALDAGAWRVLPKPVDFPSLLDLIHQAMDQPLLLVVDDDREFCENLWQLLRESGFRVALAHDGNEAEQQIEQGEFQVVLIDMKLPVGNGAAVYRRLRQAHPASRAILITGQGQDFADLVIQLLAEGADAVYYKPLNVPLFLSALRKLTPSSM